MVAIESRFVTIVNTVNVRGWGNHDYLRARGPGKEDHYVVQIAQKWIPRSG